MRPDAGDALRAARVLAARAVVTAVLCAALVALLMVLGAREPWSERAPARIARMMQRALHLPMVRLCILHSVGANLLLRMDCSILHAVQQQPAATCVVSMYDPSCRCVAALKDLFGIVGIEGIIIPAISQGWAVAEPGGGPQAQRR